MKLFISDFKKSFCTLKTLVCILAVVIVSLLCYNQDLSYIFSNNENANTSITELIDYLIGIGVFRNIILIIISIPFVGIFCDEWNNKYIYSVLSRCNIKKYVASKIISCAVGSLVVNFIGLTLLVGLLLFFIPLSGEQTVINFISDVPYGILVEKYSVLYLLLRIFIFSLFSGIWCVFGLFFSALIPNKFVSCVMPLIGYYFIGNLCDYLPDFLNINRIANCSNILGSNALLTFIYSLLFYIALVVIFIMLFYKAVRRRVNNEFN
ncbi:MAG: hypothetical protein J1E85_09595 [Ruminococcus sp.]|nr:hypothetical protein [Ruminococcus sp.]